MTNLELQKLRDLPIEGVAERLGLRKESDCHTLGTTSFAKGQGTPVIVIVIVIVEMEHVSR